MKKDFTGSKIIMVSDFLDLLEFESIHSVDSCGDTPLYYAVLWNKPDVVKELIRSGANVDHQCEYGVTALYEATCKNNIEIVKMLLAAGARTDIKDDMGYTAIDAAIHDKNNEILALFNIKL